MRTYTLEQVAAAHVPPEIKNPIRWLRERLNRGEIPGKPLTRGVWVMTDADIEQWINTRRRVSEPVDVVEPQQITSITDGLSARARRRVS